MPGILDRIKDIEDEVARTQKNKATEHHLGLLRAKVSKLRAQLMEQNSSSGGKGEGFDVARNGDARVALIGFPSVGKSSLLNLVCGTKSAEAAHEFTTLTCIPGNFEYNGTRVQILDLPGIIEGASSGKGRGRQVIAVARSADLVIMLLDAVKADIQKRLLSKELEDCGIRLNQKPPDISFVKKKGGNLKYNSTCPQSIMNERMCRGILQTYKIHHAEVLLREDITPDQLIDVVQGNRMYIPCLYAYNKIDNCTIEEIDSFAREPDSCVLSVKDNLNMPFLYERMWDKLDLIRIYTKPKGSAPDLNEPIILNSGATIMTVCDALHRELKNKFRYALVWGRSAKHRPQHVGMKHVVCDGDVVQVVVKEKH